MTSEHLSVGEIQAKTDGRLSPEELHRVDAHLAGCPQCASALEAFARLDGALRRLPIIRADSSFTRALMARLPQSAPTSRVFRVLVALPYLLALVIVLGVMAFAFFWSGAIKGEEAAGAKTVVDQGLELVGGGVKSLGGGFLQWMEPFIRRIALEGFWGTIAWGCAVLVVLFVLDRVVFRKFFHGQAA